MHRFTCNPLRAAAASFALAAALLVSGCGSSDVETAESSPQSDFRALFSAADGVLPFPSNLLFSGSLDGTLNIPVDDPANNGDPAVALNSLDGFSTTAPLSTTFGAPIDASSIPGNVRLFQVTTTALTDPLPLAVTGIVEELLFGIDFVAIASSASDDDGSTLVIVPLRPLQAASAYMVAVSRDLKSSSGDPALPDNQYRLAQRTDALTAQEFPLLTSDDLTSLNGLRLLVNAQEAALAQASPALPSEQIAVSWSFTTQSVGSVLGQARNQATASSGNFVAVGDTGALLPPGSSPNAANVFAGTLTIPYYLSNASGANGPLGPVSDFWQGAGGTHLTGLAPGVTNVPVKRSDETIPVLVSTPKAAAKPWPVVIFQHGITQNRSNLLAVADSLAAAGFAAVAIDLPLHGIHPNDATLAALRGATPAATERTFDIDLLTQDAGGNTTASSPDGVADGSGTHFINLASLQTSRDNLRQGVADLFALVTALDSMDVDGGGADFTTAGLGFVGHSLGGIVGGTFLAHETAVGPAVLAMSGGGIAKLLDGSPSFGPVIAGGLAAQGVVKGSSDYEAFLAAAQALVDSGDPINNASAAADAHPLLLFQVNGDQVVPNTVPVPGDTLTAAAPTAGTVPLAAQLGLELIGSSTQGAGLDVRLNFTAGDHGSLLRPDASLAATTVMQQAMATFIASGGASVPVSDESVVEQPAN